MKYVVKRDDTIKSLSKELGVPEKDLPEVLYIGMLIEVPEKVEEKKPAKKQPVVQESDAE